jgi:hypothetical protein
MLALGALNHGFNPQLGHGKLLSPTSLMFQTNRCGTKVYGLCLYISGFSLYSWLSNRGFKQTDVVPKFMVCVYISGFSLYSWLSNRGFKQTDVVPKFMVCICIFQDSLCIHGCQTEVLNKQMCY